MEVDFEEYNELYGNEKIVDYNPTDRIFVTLAFGSGDNYMRSETLFTYSRGAYTNFLHEERKVRRLFFARRAYSTHFTRRVVKNIILSLMK